MLRQQSQERVKVQALVDEPDQIPVVFVCQHLNVVVTDPVARHWRDQESRIPVLPRSGRSSDAAYRLFCDACTTQLASVEAVRMVRQAQRQREEEVAPQGPVQVVGKTRPQEGQGCDPLLDAQRERRIAAVHRQEHKRGGDRLGQPGSETLQVGLLYAEHRRLAVLRQDGAHASPNQLCKTGAVLGLQLAVSAKPRGAWPQRSTNQTRSGADQACRHGSGVPPLVVVPRDAEHARRLLEVRTRKQRLGNCLRLQHQCLQAVWRCVFGDRWRLAPAPSRGSAPSCERIIEALRKCFVEGVKVFLRAQYPQAAGAPGAGVVREADVLGLERLHLPARPPLHHRTERRALTGAAPGASPTHLAAETT
mmetsp:Transcript_91516/g.286342  ORF Transcript_91516/g.286342 Transcript_91516/m.286342 type:complete len:364 (-) Transcript_91516:8-1099(-)